MQCWEAAKFAIRFAHRLTRLTASLPQVDLLYDATCERIRQAAAVKKLPLPDALQPCGLPLQARYHVNFSGERSRCSADIGQIRAVTT